MAYIIDGHEAVTKAATDTVPPLARADFSGQVDVYRLAQRGDRRSRSMWNELVAHAPATARLIVKFDAAEAERDRHAQAQVDEVITKAGSGPTLPAWVRDCRDSPDPRLRELALAEIERRRAQR